MYICMLSTSFPVHRRWPRIRQGMINPDTRPSCLSQYLGMTPTIASALSLPDFFVKCSFALAPQVYWTDAFVTLPLWMICRHVRRIAVRQQQQQQQRLPMSSSSLLSRLLICFSINSYSFSNGGLIPDTSSWLWAALSSSLLDMEDTCTISSRRREPE